MRPRATLVLLSAVLLAACGGGTPGAPGPGSAAEVVEAWAADVRAGRYEDAARRFALPATVANGSAPVQLRSRPDVVAFNRSLPCGAVLTGTQAVDRGRLVATFRLTDLRAHRGSCGSGAGRPAQVAFLVRDGRIVEWLRVGDAAPPAGSVEV